MASDVVNNGHTVRYNLGSGHSMTVDGHTYELLQFHFHSLSEHSVDGLHYAMEMHLVHAEQENAPDLLRGADRGFYRVLLKQPSIHGRT